MYYILHLMIESKAMSTFEEINALVSIKASYFCEANSAASSLLTSLSL